MGSPLVSVLMPVYNGQRYLQVALESVLAQTFRDFELVVVDDGSIDDSPHILNRCRDSRVKSLRAEHLGLIGALNTGIGHCSGVYIARMDADDVSYPDRLERQVQCLSANPHVAVVTCWSNLLDEAGHVTGRRPGGVSDDMLLELAAGNQIVHGSIMMRRDCLPPAPVYQKPPEDFWLWVYLARAGRQFQCIPEVLYGFRTHGERYSLTHAQSQSAGIVEVQWPLLEVCSRSRDLDDLSVRSRLVRGWGSVAGAAYRAGDPLRGDMARRRFLQLAGNDWTGLCAAAIQYGIESMIWGGCPWHQECGLRWLEWKRRPRTWDSYRNLFLSLPPTRQLRALMRRDAKNVERRATDPDPISHSASAYQDAFERLDIDETGVDPAQLRLHIARYEFACPWAAGRRVLDIACGTGYGTAILARAGAASVVGVDIDAPTIEQARSRHSRTAVSFLVGDAERPPVSDRFDLIVSFETIEHLQRPEQFLQAVHRLLDPSGLLIVSSPCRRVGSLGDRPRNPFHVREWNQPEFAQLLRQYFGQVSLFGQLIEFAKNALPFNRSLARLITALVSPSRLRALNSCEVQALENLPHFDLRIAYLVAVCSQPKI